MKWSKHRPKSRANMPVAEVLSKLNIRKMDNDSYCVLMFDKNHRLIKTIVLTAGEKLTQNLFSGFMRSARKQRVTGYVVFRKNRNLSEKVKRRSYLEARKFRKLAWVMGVKEHDFILSDGNTRTSMTLPEGTNTKIRSIISTSELFQRLS